MSSKARLPGSSGFRSFPKYACHLKPVETMQLIPVIDIRNGIVVRAVAGRRDLYQPLQSVLTESIEPANVLRDVCCQIPATRCYVADLDAIERQQLNRCSLAEMIRLKIPLLVDAGVTSAQTIEDLLDLGVAQVIVSTESFPDLTLLTSLVDAFGSKSLCGSIDLKGGALLLADSDRSLTSPEDMVQHFLQSGFSEIVVLDLAAVGSCQGIPTLPFCQSAHSMYPNLKLITGGGVSSADCLAEAQQAGVDAILISSAIHSGQLLAQDLQRFCHF